MLFNSFEFLVFLVIVFVGYWFLFSTKLKAQNLWILFSSYVFYGWWDWRFLALIFASSIIDYTIGNYLHRTSLQGKRKALLILSITVNIGALFFFKYYDFFIESLLTAVAELGVNVSPSGYTLNVILPVGISFYTFQTLSYTIDIYNRKIVPSTNPIAYLAFVSFFPQLLAGPIERAKNLLPQFECKRSFSFELAKDGMRQILWGLFKKVAIADPTGVRVSFIYENFDLLSASNLLAGMFLFTFQLYIDFSAYSDIAIGVGRLFGINLSQNFRYPLFSIDFRDFWKRWHISLSSWFKDYAYIALGGSKFGQWKTFRNIMIVFFLTGVWHGSNNLNGIIFGLLFGIFTYTTILISNIISPKKRSIPDGQIFPNGLQIFQMSLVFILFSFVLIFFRLDSTEIAFQFIYKLFSMDIFSKPNGLKFFIPILIIMALDWVNKHKAHPLMFDYLPRPARWGVYYILIFYILKTQIDTSPYLYYHL